MATTSDVPTTTVEAEAAGRRVFSGDWDADGTTSVYLPRKLAIELLRARGWTMIFSGHVEPVFHSWRSPSGATYWETGDALQVALAAEVSS